MANDFKALIEAQRETTRAVMSAEERAEMDAAIAEEQHKEKIKNENRIEGGRKAWQTRQANQELAAAGSSAKEDAQEKAASEKKTQNLLGKIANGVTGMFGKMGEKVKGAGKGIMAMLKGTLVAGLLLAVMAFLESKYWTDTKDFIVNKVVPMLVDFYENILKPIGVIFADFFIATWENIKTLFSGLGESFDLFANGEWWEGIKTMVTSIGTFLGTLLDDVLTAVWNTIATVFGMSKTDSVFGSIWGFFTDTYDEVVSWIKITWFNIKTTISETWTNIKTTVVKVFTDVKDWIVGVFSWASEGIAKGWTTVTTFIKGVWDSVVLWFEGLWTWASDGIAKGWTTVTTFITGIWDSVVKWFKGLWTWASDGIAKTWTGVTNFIKGVWDSVVLWFEGLWTWGEGAIAGTWTGVTNFIKGVWDSVVAWFSKLWTWAEGTIAGTWTGVSGFIKGVWDSVVAWFSKLWTWGTGVATKGWTNLTGFIKDVWDSVYKWFSGLWSWAVEKGKTPGGEEWSITKMISGVFNAAKDWFVGLFTWKKAKPKEGEEEFSISKMISDLWKDITQALSDIFPSMADLRAMLPSLSDVKDTMLGWIGLGGDKDKDKMNKKAAGGPFTSGTPMLVGELGPELILPSTGGKVVNAQRTSQIQAAGLRRGAGSSGGAPAVVNAPVNTINNSQSNTTVTSTELKHPSAILNKVNLAA